MTVPLAAGAVAPVALGAYLALAFLELRRPDRRHRTGRLVALAAAVVALALLALAPARMIRRLGTRAVLLTEGATESDAARAADSAGAALVIRLADSTANAAAIRTRLPSVAELLVVGWGIDSARLPEFSGFDMRFLPAPLPRGVVEARWPARIVEGDELVVRGRVNRQGPVYLTGADGSVDSAVAADDGEFALCSVPRSRGFATLLLRAGPDTETVAVHVSPAPPIRLLVLQSSPDYESSRLRDWVARRGGSVAMRTLVSSGRWRRERVNTDAGPLDPLTPALLRRFDVAAIDAEALRTMPRAARAALDAAVHDEGLGLLVDPVAPPFDAPKTAAGTRAARIRIGPALTAAVTLSPPALRDHAARGVLFRDESGRAVAEWRIQGAGRVASSLVRNPSRWTLGGDRELFDRYWSGLLGAVARPAPSWALGATSFAGPGEPIRISRLGEVVGRAIIRRPDGASDTVALEAGADSGSSDGVYHPRVAGRHLIANAPDTAGFDVQAPDAWRGVRAARRREATLAWTALRELETGPSRGPPAREPYPRWWFLALFLCGAGYLWRERRSVSRG